VSDQTKVYVVSHPGYRNYRLRWRDSGTGKWVYKSSGVIDDGRKKSRLAAEKVAAQLEADLNAGRYQGRRGITWADFRQRYESEVLPGLARNTGIKSEAVFNLLEAILRTVAGGRLRELTAEKLSGFQAELRTRGKAESTIAGYLAYLQAALQWAVDQGMLPALPKFPRIKRAKRSKMMKGRPLTGEEFERMLAAVPKVLSGADQQSNPAPGKKKGRGKRIREVGPEVVEAWRYYLHGLWLSGLRLEESLNLWWDRSDRPCIDLTGKYPMVRIPAELEKGHKDRLLPVTPDFAELLLATPQESRKGRVFKLPSLYGGVLTKDRVCKIGVRLGKAAGINVHTRPKSGKVKYASLHDLRRSFAARSSSKVMPEVLMELMRHESIETTMRYYVGRNAQTTAEILWETVAKPQGAGPADRHPGSQKEAQKGAILGATGPFQVVACVDENSVSDCNLTG